MIVSNVKYDHLYLIRWFGSLFQSQTLRVGLKTDCKLFFRVHFVYILLDVYWIFLFNHITIIWLSWIISSQLKLIWNRLTCSGQIIVRSEAMHIESLPMEMAFRNFGIAFIFLSLKKKSLQNFSVTTACQLLEGK